VIIYGLNILKDPETPGYGFVRGHHKGAHEKYIEEKQIQTAKAGSQKKYLPFNEPGFVLLPVPKKDVDRIE
jgi:hypothetical protein